MEDELKKHGIKVADRVIVAQNAILAQLNADTPHAARQKALCDKYFITGVGRTCYGIRNESGSLRFNTPHENVVTL